MGVRHFIAIAGTTAMLLAACSMPSVEGDLLAGDRSGKSGTKPTSDNGACVEAITAEDPAKYPKCACGDGGQARCIPKGKVPAAVASSLDTCTEGGPGLCVPDKLVKSGGAAPKTCNSPFGEGRCMSLCVPEIAQKAGLLNRGEGDVCDEDERCAPCLNPLKNNEPTGVCEIGKQNTSTCEASTPAPGGQGGPAAPSNLACPYTGAPVVDVKTFPACDAVAGVTPAGMRCVPQSLVPASAAAMLAKCATGLCAPEKSIAAGGQYLPKTCSAVAGAEGRCLNTGIPQVLAQKAQLTKDVCDAEELCTPCYNPMDGKETGACKTVSCDAAKQPAKTFTACCEKQGTSRAKCVPKALVPASQQGNLDDDDGTCNEATELCVPNEMLQPNFKGPACSGSTFLTGDYTGVCLSDCLSFGFIQSLGISKGSCLSGFKCAPCVNPLSGNPTGAPGCPGT